MPVHDLVKGGPACVNGAGARGEGGHGASINAGLWADEAILLIIVSYFIERCKAWLLVDLGSKVSSVVGYDIP
jgi:hypothetical protein